MSLSSSLFVGRQILNHCNQFLRKNQLIIKEQLRYLNLHENIAYSLLKEAGIPTPPFGVAKTPDEAAKIATELKSQDLVVKAQVLTGGRGKGHFQNTDVSGVVMCESAEKVKQISEIMIGKLLITKQTGAAGRICNSVMVTTRMFPRKEYYLSIMLERTFNGIVVIASSKGGVNIEEIAATDPEALLYVPVDIIKGLTSEQINCIIQKLGVKGKGKDIVSLIICNLYELFLETDALLIEINPLAEDICGEYYALDCKCNFDDSSKFRQKKLFALEDWSQKDPNEARAKKFDLNYIQLDGIVGCMVNGAGLAMATMDLISFYGVRPANFLDVGGSATKETIIEAFTIITTDPKVLAIFVNIFGGIMRCDIIAEGIIAATKELQTTIPIIIRLEGTNVEKAKKLISESKLKLIFIDDFEKAGESITKFATIISLARSLNLDVNFVLKSNGAKNKKEKC
ncbi:succinate--CoA ligase [ADP-forming] subunit beta, mitochondrial-like isoform X2 [Vespa mandarinia]|uniref:succinate--CoA ligase [ADP-forming] subunit beta, mitochondrial-like isoform X2 n=1 Tax=Vespa mandarinia TaxID=7446 RepID=UPI00161B0288|nr:succinate--CoA ligase [ADP-forming] subunit beta, mitochondrial-like isoform X2 [Vespa mandarinia]